METLLCAAVGTGSLQRDLQICAVYHRSGNMLKRHEAVLNLSALN
jgi:hypothetical protein